MLIGTAGSPGTSTIEGISIVRSSGLDAMEVEFVYGVKMTNALAKEVGSVAKKNNIMLSVHAPYYINLASKDATKQRASKQRIMDSCERGHNMGAKNIVFHAAMYQGRQPDEVYPIVKTAVEELMKAVEKNKLNVELCPEITGKLGQFGSIDELLKLKKDTGCSMCIDFAHLLARNQGKTNYDDVMKQLPKTMHIHWSGITYTQKGEKNHEPIDIARTKELIKFLKKYEKNGTIICESPDPLGDAIKIKKLF